MGEYLQLVLDGIAAGTHYALIAVAMVIIYKTSEVLNFAQGEMGLICAFFAYLVLRGPAVDPSYAVWLDYLKSLDVSVLGTFLFQEPGTASWAGQAMFHLRFWLATPTGAFAGAVIFSILVGLFIEFFFMRRAKEANLLGLIMITLGAEMVIIGLVGWKFAGLPTELRFLLPEMPTLKGAGGVTLFSGSDLTALVVAVAAMVGLALFFRTKIGVAMRATQQNQIAARVMGIRTNRIISLAWALSSILGALAALFIAAGGDLKKTMMLDPMLHGFAAAVLGGMTSLLGAALGGYILGAAKTILANLIDQGGDLIGLTGLGFKWGPVIPFAIVVLVLAVRPSGLFARHYVKKV